MKGGKPIIAVYDTKPYDRDYLTRAAGAGELDWHFHEFRMEPETAFAAKETLAVCVFVNDVVNREVLERLAGSGVRLVALRCAGFNNVDLDAAKELGVAVTRVPSYSPHAVAEHTMQWPASTKRRPRFPALGKGNQTLLKFPCRPCLCETARAVD